MGAFGKTTIWVILIICLVSIQNGKGQSPTPALAPAPMMMGSSPTGSAPGDDCMSLLLNMSDCLSFGQKGSNLTKPDKNCCPELAGLLDTNPICLCELLGKTKDFDLDVNRALKLPSLCKLDTPDVSLCSMAGYPVGAPEGSPAGAPEGSSSGEAPSALSPGGISPDTAATAEGKNGASSVDVTVAYVVGSLVIAFTLL
ncbi:unnamed protein product [Amaranthus hypochondriacus]